MVRKTITRRELASALGWCLQTVNRRVRDGSIRTISVGPSKIIPATELPRLLGEHVPGVEQPQSRQAV
jgi:hypothetical protein